MFGPFGISERAKRDDAECALFTFIETTDDARFRGLAGRVNALSPDQRQHIIPTLVDSVVISGDRSVAAQIILAILVALGCSPDAPLYEENREDYYVASDNCHRRKPCVGPTALEMAMSNRDPQLVAALVMAGANPTMTTGELRPYEYALVRRPGFLSRQVFASGTVPGTATVWDVFEKHGVELNDRRFVLVLAGQSPKLTGIVGKMIYENMGKLTHLMVPNPLQHSLGEQCKLLFDNNISAMPMGLPGDDAVLAPREGSGHPTHYSALKTIIAHKAYHLLWLFLAAREQDVEPGVWIGDSEMKTDCANLDFTSRDTLAVSAAMAAVAAAKNAPPRRRLENVNVTIHEHPIKCAGCQKHSLVFATSATPSAVAQCLRCNDHKSPTPIFSTLEQTPFPGMDMLRVLKTQISQPVADLQAPCKDAVMSHGDLLHRVIAVRYLPFNKRTFKTYPLWLQERALCAYHCRARALLKNNVSLWLPGELWELVFAFFATPSATNDPDDDDDLMDL